MILFILLLVFSRSAADNSVQIDGVGDGDQKKPEPLTDNNLDSKILSAKNQKPFIPTKQNNLDPSQLSSTESILNKNENENDVENPPEANGEIEFEDEEEEEVEMFADDEFEQTSSFSQIKKKKNKPTSYPQKTLHRLGATYNIPKIDKETEPIPIATPIPTPSMSNPPQTPTPTPHHTLRRMNATHHIPKIESPTPLVENSNNENSNLNNENKIEDNNSDSSENDEKDDISISQESDPTENAQKEENKINEEKASQDQNQGDNNINDNNNNTNNNDNNKKDHHRLSIDNSKLFASTAKFAIVSLNLQNLSTSGDEKLIISLNTSIIGPAFIRFGSKILTGRLSNEGRTVKCLTPRLPVGEVEIAVSENKVKWSNSIIVYVVNDENENMIFFGCAGIAVVVVALMVTRLMCGKRAVPKKKKTDQRVDVNSFRISAPSLNNNDLHKRTKFTMDP